MGDSNVVRYLREILDRPGKPGVRHVAAEALEGVMARALALWPQHAAWFARKKDDGRAEAALIARWWWQTHGAGRVAA